MGDVIDMTGKRFGSLTVIERAPDKVWQNGKHERMWRCICDCGNEKIAAGGSLRAGYTLSCGCGRRKKYNDIPLPKQTTIQGDLIIGRSYWIDKQLVTLVGLYPTYARFEDEHGQHDCYLYWDLERMMRL